jgi:polyhydroxyalkanoate synthesis regulator protein
MFQEAMKVFVPFAGMPGVAPANPPSTEAKKPEAAEPLQSLQEQMKEMQRQIDRLAGKKD